ncbi:hypothetical protein ACFLS1_06735 [Verrucomicrobiota bacterium]
MKSCKIKLIIMAICCLGSFLLLPVSGSEPEDREESAGGSFTFLLNPEDDIYGMSWNSGSWLKNTPVFGDYSMRLLSNKIEDSFYSGLGLTIRLMPHQRFAPFIGVGGSYNYSASSESSDDDDDELEDRGASYWGGHVEAGFRVWLRNRMRLFEIMGRYTWSSLGDDHEYWLVGIGTGLGI